MRQSDLVSPSRITYDELPRFLHMRQQAEHLSDCQIRCDCSALTFADPIGLCLLKHWFFELEERGVQIDLYGLRYQTEVYLERMDLFKGIGSVTFKDRTSNKARLDLRGRIIELRSLSDINDVGSVANQIAATIVHGIPDISCEQDPDQMHPSIGEKMEDTLQYLFSEILINALDHGRKRNYSHASATISAGYYPSENKVEVGILDNGCGLLETLRGHPMMQGISTDEKAISIAYQPRVSCNRDAELGLDTRNQGIGLTVSAKIALQASGRFGIFSGGSRLGLLQDGASQQIEIPYWRGTGVFFQFDKNALSRVSKKSIIEALPGFKINKRINFG
jgi:ABC-type transporter Mla MlaB component